MIIISCLNKNEYNKILDDNDKKFPIDLDQPNNSNFPDLPIEFVD